MQVECNSILPQSGYTYDLFVVKLVWHEKCVHEKKSECMNDEWSMLENEQKNNNLSHVA